MGWKLASKSVVCLGLLTACSYERFPGAESAELSKTIEAEAKDRAAAGIALSAAVAAPGEPFGSGTQWSQIAVDGMIIRTGTASLELDSLERGVAAIRDLAARVSGYLANSQIQSGDRQYRTATLEIKVPAARFDELLSGLRPIGKLENVSVSAQDVGEEFTDLSARVTNAHRLEQRLIELLATRTGKLSDVLEIERELARVREEIERMEGRLRYLKARAAVSTLSVTLHEPAPLVGEEGSPSVMAEAFRQAWRNFIGLSAGVIASLGVVLPLGLGLLGVAALVRRWRPARRTA